MIDVGSEKAVLAGIYQYGNDALIDVSDIISSNSFSVEANQILYTCLEQALQDNQSIDLTAVMTTADRMGLTNRVFKDKNDIGYIRALFNFPIKLENVRGYAKRLAKLEFARKAQARHKEAHDELGRVKGSESIDEILAISEGTIFDLIQEINQGKDDQPQQIAENSDELLQHLIDNPCDMAGFPTPWPCYNTIIGGGLRKGGVNLIAARPKQGKMQPTYSGVVTPNGWKTMGDLKVGDYVCTPFSTNSKITHIIDNGTQPVYRIYFSHKEEPNGDYIDCGLEHLFKVKHRRKKEYEILSLKQILNFGNKKLYEEDYHRPKWFIPLSEPVQFEKQDVDLDPYIMGLLLGDGSFRDCISLTTIDKELKDALENYIDNNYWLRKSGKMSYVITRGQTGGKSNKYRDIIRKYGLWNKTSHTKFIPKQYLYNTIKNRWKLLQGLMDTDGSANGSNAAEYSTVSKDLAIGVEELVHSLGGLCHTRIRTTKCNGKKFKSYRLHIKFNDNSKCFKLKRKIDNCRKRQKPELKRSIKDVEYLGNYHCKCIKIEDDRGLYLTDNYTVTHNSSCGKEVALHFTMELNVPVLFLDTEMVKNDHLFRSIASLSEVSLNDIETGKFGANETIKQKVLDANKQLKQIRFHHKVVAGKPFEEILSIIRRWIMKEVGYDDNGNVNNCLIIYDYFKLMNPDSLENMQEYQALGFQISRLSDFCKEYDFPCLAFVQVNRDGIKKETSDILAQSDRLLWLCHSASVFKTKEPEERMDDDSNRKMIVLETRFGPGMPDKDNYINMQFDGEFSKITERGFQKDNHELQIKQEGFENDIRPGDDLLGDSESNSGDT